MYHYKDHIIDENRKEIQYAKKIIDGTYLADEPEINACKRFLRDLERQNDDDFPYCYDYGRADRFFSFFSQCANVDAPEGTLLKLAEFQYFDFGNFFGFVEKDTGRRRFAECLIFQSRGQGKSSALAVIGLYVLTADAIYPPYQPEKRHYELNPSVVSVAVDLAQTRQVRGTAFEIARRSPFLKDKIIVKNTYIKSRLRGGEFVAASKETGNLDGMRPNMVCVDESAAHKEHVRVDSLRGGGGKREQFSVFRITTAGDDATIKPEYSHYLRCLEILKGNIVDESYLAIIRQLNEKDDPADFSLYEKCAAIPRSATSSISFVLI